MPEPPSIFISYARKDAAGLAKRLYHDLAAIGFAPWLDTEHVESGAVWTAEIEDAIDHAQVTLALLTPASFRSEICRAEQLRSLRKGKCVIPLLAAPNADRPLHLEARNYRDFTDDRAYAANLPLLLGDIASRNGVTVDPAFRTTRVRYVTSPPTVANYIHRPGALRALRDALFRVDEHRPISLTALEGMGGIGKTVLAQALFKDEVVQQAFPDGLVWITVGREPAFDFAAKLREIADMLTPPGGAVAAGTLYATAIREKAALIVIDDIWSKEHLDWFLADSPRSRFLFTTRDSSITRFSGAREHRADLLDDAQSRELLAAWAGLDAASLPVAAADILRECGRLPLARISHEVWPPSW